MSKKNSLYKSKEASYFSNVREDIIKLVSTGKDKVLEIGCGNGTTLMELKRQNKAKYVAGVDIVDMGQSEVLDKFILADIETDKLNFPKECFDVIICADVLEHLINPWGILKKLKKYLKDDGVVIASIPNIREIKTIFTIVIEGDFKYMDSGILDKTHLRFFCRKNISEMFYEAGLQITKITYNLSPKRNILNKITFGIFEEFLVVQYIIEAKRKDK